MLLWPPNPPCHPLTIHSCAHRRQYQDFRIGNDGALSGVGMMIASDPDSGKLVVLAPIKGSPAEAAGIQPGDEVGCEGREKGTVAAGLAVRLPP